MIALLYLGAEKAFAQIDPRDPRRASLTNFTQSSSEVFIDLSDMPFEDVIRYAQRGFVDTNRFEEARRSPESQPEAEDPQGNWGPVAEGFRASLRFSTNQFLPGQPLMATLLLRNVIKRDLKFYWSFTDWDFDFVVRDRLGRVLPAAEADPATAPFLGAKTLPIYPRTQRRFKIRLDSHFKFGPGDYSIAVTTIVPKLAEPGATQITSGTAHFKIIAPAAGTGTNTAPSGP